MPFGNADEISLQGGDSLVYDDTGTDKLLEDNGQQKFSRIRRLLPKNENSGYGSASLYDGTGMSSSETRLKELEEKEAEGSIEENEQKELKKMRDAVQKGQKDAEAKKETNDYDERKGDKESADTLKGIEQSSQDKYAQLQIEKAVIDKAEIGSSDISTNTAKDTKEIENAKDEKQQIEDGTNAKLSDNLPNDDMSVLEDEETIMSKLSELSDIFFDSGMSMYEDLHKINDSIYMPEDRSQEEWSSKAKQMRDEHAEKVQGKVNNFKASNYNMEYIIKEHQLMEKHLKLNDGNKAKAEKGAREEAKTILDRGAEYIKIGIKPDIKVVDALIRTEDRTGAIPSQVVKSRYEQEKTDKKFTEFSSNTQNINYIQEHNNVNVNQATQILANSKDYFSAGVRKIDKLDELMKREEKIVRTLQEEGKKKIEHKGSNPVNALLCERVNRRLAQQKDNTEN